MEYDNVALSPVLNFSTSQVAPAADTRMEIIWGKSRIHPVFSVSVGDCFFNSLFLFLTFHGPFLTFSLTYLVSYVPEMN